MAQTIYFKRSTTSNAPSSLAFGEPAYSDKSKQFFIGDENGNPVLLSSVALVQKMAGVEAGANRYVHPTSPGNKHIPSGGSSGKYLRWKADGEAEWASLPTAPVTSVNGKTGNVSLNKSDIGLGNVDNTADSAKVVAKAARLTTARKIAGVNFDGSSDISIPLANLTTDANHRVMTDAEKSALQSLIEWKNAMTSDDDNNVIDTITEIINAFQNAPEGFDVAAEIANLKTRAIDGGTF